MTPVIQKTRVCLWLGALLACGSLLACASPKLPPTTACLSSSDVVVQDSFLVSVNDVSWRDEVTRPGYDAIPQSQRAVLGEQMKARPQAEFLVIDLDIGNMGKQPQAWSSPFASYNKLYRLQSTDNSVYDSTPALSSLNAATSSGNINPGMEANGSVVFDVPRGSYDFIILHTKPLGFGNRYIAQPIFKCSIDAG